MTDTNKLENEKISLYLQLVRFEIKVDLKEV